MECTRHTNTQTNNCTTAKITSRERAREKKTVEAKGNVAIVLLLTHSRSRALRLRLNKQQRMNNEDANDANDANKCSCGRYYYDYY